MGSLKLPKSGLVYVDAQILIYTVEMFPQYFEALISLWQASKSRHFQVVTSELTVLEVMTGPIKTGRQFLIDIYEDMFASNEIWLIPIDMQVLMDAAKLRAKIPLHTPDAIHAATALVSSCETFITNDLAFRAITSINVQILKDII